MFGSRRVVPFLASVKVGIADLTAEQNDPLTPEITDAAAEYVGIVRRRLDSAVKRTSEAQRSQDFDEGKPVFLLNPCTKQEIDLAQALCGTDALRLILHEPLPPAGFLSDKTVIAEIVTDELTAPEQELAFKQAREILIRQCDLLIAMVDTPEAIEVEIQHFAMRERKAFPVIAIPVAQPGEAVLMSIESNTMVETRDISTGLNSWLDRLLLPDEAQRLMFKKWEPGFTLGGLYPYLLWLLTGIRPGAASFSIGNYEDREQGALPLPRIEWLRNENQALWDEIRRQYTEAYVWSDQLALYYGNLARTHILGLVLGGLIASCAIVLALLDMDGWKWVELGALIGVIVTALLMWSRHLQQNWLDYRLLAELIRPMPYLGAIAGRFTPAAQTKGRAERMWNRSVWQYQSIARGAWIPKITFDPAYLSDAKTVLTGLVDTQIDWHESNEKKQHKMHERLHRLAIIAFVSIVAISLGHAVLGLEASEHLQKTWELRLLGAAGVLTALASLLGAALNYFRFDQIADRSESARRQFERLKSRMEHHYERPTIEQVTGWANEVAAIMAEEQLDWHNQMSNISVHLG